MEQIIIDSLGNEITLTYDETTDKVMVLNPAFDSDFREVKRLMRDTDELVIIIDGLEGEGSWETWSDIETRNSVMEFWLNNKKDKQ